MAEITQQQSPAAPGTAPKTPSQGARTTAALLVAGSLVAAFFFDAGSGFTPRIETIDGLAGLVMAAFLVDRLLTFVPPMGAEREPKQRALDLTVLRLGYGTAIGAAFVILTDLHAVAALAPDSGVTVSAGVDRCIAVLAIAGGVTGLATLVGALNPKQDTDGNATPDKASEPGTIPAPSAGARLGGPGLLLIALAVAFLATALGDEQGVDLVGPEQQTDATMAVVVRFGAVLLAAGIVQLLVDQVSRYWDLPTNDKTIIMGGIASVLGVAAAWAFDLYLLHNIGFFGATPGVPLNDALAGSSVAERYADVLLTGLVIAGGAKPLHDLGARLRKTREKAVAPA